MKKSVLVSSLAAFAASSAFAQAPAAPASASAPKALKVGVVEIQRLWQDSLLGKSYATKIDQLESEVRSEFTKRQNELGKLDTATKALEEELQKQASILSADAQEKKRQEIVKKNRERTAFAEDSQAEIQRMQETARQRAQELQAEFNQKIQPLLQAVAKEKGVDFVLDRSSIILINTELDLTRDVIVKADDAEKAARKPAAAPASAAPAAPAPAPAGPPPAAKPTPTPETR